jgi:hypothetical protein
VQARFNELVDLLKSYSKDQTYYSEHQDFWLPKTRSLFSTKPSSKDLRFLYWDPKVLISKLECPELDCTLLLKRNGWRSQPGKALTLDGRVAFYIVGPRYCCAVHGQFKSWDSGLLEGLPQSARLHFPAEYRDRDNEVLYAVMEDVRISTQYDETSVLSNGTSSPWVELVLVHLAERIQVIIGVNLLPNPTTIKEKISFSVPIPRKKSMS